MSISIDQILASLQAQLNEFDASIVRQKSELGATMAGRRKVAAALRPLLEKDRVEAPTDDTVRPVVLDLLGANPGGLDYDELYDLVRDHLAAEGYGAQGLGLRVKNALKDGSVTKGADGRYTLRGD
ncbi:MAG: hypothetical protein ACRCT8_02655 [Lacipirellulaceae bacterium]